MVRLTSRYLLHAVIVLLVVTFLTTLLLDLVPGDPVYAILGENANPQQAAILRHELYLDQPLIVRYGHWLWDSLQGNLGSSPRTLEPVSQAILERAPVTIELAVLGLLLSLVIAVPLGVLTAARQGKAVDEAATVVNSVLISMPQFVAALVLTYIFSVELHLFPTLGWAPIGEIGDNLHYIFIPALTLALFEIPVFARLLRADMISTLGKDFILGARSRGLSSSYVLFRHALRPSSFSLLTLGGLSLGRLLGGAIIVEVIFGLPGIGQMLLNAITNKDLVTVQGGVLIITVAYVVINAVIDVLYGLLDPRVRAHV